MELHEDALERKEIMDLLVNPGLMKTVNDIGRCFTHLVREFIVNIPTDCDGESSSEYMKVYVRGKCVNFSLEVVNEFLGRRPVARLDEEPELNRVAKTLTGKMVKKWPKKGLLPSGKLTTKYVVLFKIRWPPIISLTLKHAGSYAVRLSILFPSLLSELIVKQHPHVVRPDETQGNKPMPLKFDYRLFVGTHDPDIMLSAAKGPASTSGFQDQEEECGQAHLEIPAAAEEGNSEDIAENVEDDSVAHEEEEAQYETAGEEEDASERDNEETDAEEEEDVTGSTISSPRSTSL
ncbi:uncharacterized protein LOC130744168 [Lotus japonicus]|uniref:uncharacterized protein LOC130744168 n=1 Tax=Lotus japonicus TaxID=34305 RepID=UPI002584CD04|nr:uncharacterized protein LOC130744168 [Lotus japonicus]